MRIGVLLGSTRHGRTGAGVAAWVLQTAADRNPVYEVIDLLDHVLPHLAEPVPPKAGHYTFDETKAWSAFVSGFDAFVVVTPEYNAGIPGVLKNAFDHLYREWNGKPVGLVGYGVYGGARALAQLHALVQELQMVEVVPQVQLSTFDDFDGGVAPTPERVEDLRALLQSLEDAAATSERHPDDAGLDRSAQPAGR